MPSPIGTAESVPGRFNRPCGTSLDFSQTCLSQRVTNDGCPISARFWQMWDSTDLDLDCARSEEQWTSGFVDSREADDRQPWIPTSAKTGQIWGTHHSLTTEITPLATIGFLEVREKFRLAGFLDVFPGLAAWVTLIHTCPNLARSLLRLIAQDNVSMPV